MSTALPSSADIIAELNSLFFSGQNWVYFSGGNGSTTYNWINEKGAVIYTGPGIDCSHLIQQTMLAAGYNVGYITTTGYKDSQTGVYHPGMIDIINGTPSSSYSVVATPNLQVGNVVVFNGPDGGHTGIVTSYDPSTGIGTYSGMQSTNTGLKQTVAFSTNPSTPRGNVTVNVNGTDETLFLSFGGTNAEQFVGALQPASQAYNPAAAAASLNVFQQNINAGLQSAGLPAYYTLPVTPFVAQNTIPSVATNTISSDGTTSGSLSAAT